MIQVRDILVQNSLVNKKFLETIRIEDGKIFHLDYHQLRLNESIKSSEIILKELILPPQKGLYRCRVVYDEKSYEVSYHPYIKRSIKSLKLIDGKDIQYDKKYLDRSAIDALVSQKESADDILIVKNGLITDTSIANIAFLYKNEWITPQEPLLYGTTRRRLLAQNKIITVQISYEDILKFEGIALMNAMIDFDIIHNKNIEDIIC